MKVYRYRVYACTDSIRKRERFLYDSITFNHNYPVCFVLRIETNGINAFG